MQSKNFFYFLFSFCLPGEQLWRYLLAHSMFKVSLVGENELFKPTLKYKSKRSVLIEYKNVIFYYISRYLKVHTDTKMLW